MSWVDSAPDSGDSAGFYGKLPALGDFVTRRLPARFIDTWDLWLRESLAESRDVLGAEWLPTYLTSPLWRFALTPGVAGESGWAGVLMPSVDRVGRYFPFTIACPIAAACDPLDLLRAQVWFERAERVALRGLEDSATFPALDADIAALGAPLSVVASSPPPDTPAGPWRLRLTGRDPLPGACLTLLRAALSEVFLGYSLWWTTGSEQIEPSLLCCQGLPTAGGFAAMLGGAWSDGGWESLDAADLP
jgi:type VI secretion system protein ImpM